MKKGQGEFLQIALLLIQGLTLLLMVSAIVIFLGFTSQSDPKEAFKKFSVDGISRACTSFDGIGNVLDFKLPENFFIAQFYVATDTDSDVYDKTTDYGENKGYETLKDKGYMETLVSTGQFPVDPRLETEESSWSEEPVFAECQDKDCLCLIEYKGCQYFGIWGSYYDTLEDFASNITVNAYPKEPEAIEKQEMSFEDSDTKYEFIGTARHPDIAGCGAGITGECLRNMLQIYDGFTRQFFGWKPCKDAIEVVKCSSMESLQCRKQPTGKLDITQIPLLIKQDQKLYGFSMFPSKVINNGIKIEYMQIKKDEAGYLYIDQKTKGSG